MTTFPPDVEKYVQKVSSGQFASREQFVAHAIRLYKDLERKHNALKADIAAALEQSARGETRPLDIEAMKRQVASMLNRTESD